uniref:Uncharacterized protein n=1 Tax=Ananas comosus var. bracteatus TaxID=296719 RepID=A0A6V7PRN6_ANACO|nr:unnamed protein product [Ananas comosus var. bracteatus]
MKRYVGVEELPLEPSLSRTLIEANDLGCLSQALTVAATLSAEITFHQARSKGKERKRKQLSSLPDGSGWGDHIQLLQIYENWDLAGYDPDWCADNDLQKRSMMFSEDVRKQLSQIIQKIAKGPTEVQSSSRHKRNEHDYEKLRRALCVGYGNQLAERMLHHNGYRTLGYSGGSHGSNGSEPTEDKTRSPPASDKDVKQPVDVDSKIQAAPERYLARKGKR